MCLRRMCSDNVCLIEGGDIFFPADKLVRNNNDKNLHFASESVGLGGEGAIL